MVHPVLRPTEQHKKILLKTARHLAPHLDQIIHGWSETYRKIQPMVDSPTLDQMKTIARSYFKIQSGEIELETGFDEMAGAAKRLYQLRTSFDDLILSFHLIEDCCLPYIKKIHPHKEKLIEAMIAMDYLCHSCFSIISTSYFDEKYAGTIRPARPEQDPAKISRRPHLTQRESQVLKRVADGFRNREIAEMLEISIKTVEHHRASLMRKLKVRNTADLIRFAIQNTMV